MSNRRVIRTPRRTNAPKRLSFRGLGGFLWPRPKKASQEVCNPSPGCTAARARSPNQSPGKRSGAKRRRAKKTAPQSRKVHGIPTYLCRTVKLNPLHVLLNHPSGFPFGVWGAFFGQDQRKPPRRSATRPRVAPPVGVAAQSPLREYQGVSFQTLTSLRSQSHQASMPSPVRALTGMISMFGLRFLARSVTASRLKSK